MRCTVETPCLCGCMGNLPSLESPPNQPYTQRMWIRSRIVDSDVSNRLF